MLRVGLIRFVSGAEHAARRLNIRKRPLHGKHEISGKLPEASHLEQHQAFPKKKPGFWPGLNHFDR
jgi:hypothetical protein